MMEKIELKLIYCLVTFRKKLGFISFILFFGMKIQMKKKNVFIASDLRHNIRYAFVTKTISALSLTLWAKRNETKKTNKFTLVYEIVVVNVSINLN